MTVTTAIACPAGSWTPLVDGAAFKSCGIQLASTVPAALVIAANAPAAGSDGFILLSPSGDKSVMLELGKTDKVFGMGKPSASKVRLYKAPV